MATDSESIREDVTRLRMRMVQQKLANERERLQRPESSGASDNGYENQLKLQQAMLKRQELLDRIRLEQTDDKRPRTYTPRRRYTPSPLPPPTRRSLPDLGRTYHIGLQNPVTEMPQVKHVIEHQFRQAPQAAQQTLALPPIQQQVAAVPMSPVPMAQVAQVQPVAASYSAVPAIPVSTKQNAFNKADFMDMMMMQNAQMHHMVMQQMMLQNLPGGRPATWGGIAEPYAVAPVAGVVRAAPSVYHHHIQNQPYGPPMDHYQQGYW